MLRHFDEFRHDFFDLGTRSTACTDKAVVNGTEKFPALLKDGCESACRRFTFFDIRLEASCESLMIPCLPEGQFFFDVTLGLRVQNGSFTFSKFLFPRRTPVFFGSALMPHRPRLNDGKILRYFRIEQRKALHIVVKYMRHFMQEGTFIG